MLRVEARTWRRRKKTRGREICVRCLIDVGVFSDGKVRLLVTSPRIPALTRLNKAHGLRTELDDEKSARKKKSPRGCLSPLLREIKTGLTCREKRTNPRQDTTDTYLSHKNMTAREKKSTFPFQVLGKGGYIPTSFSGASRLHTDRTYLQRLRVGSQGGRGPPLPRPRKGGARGRRELCLQVAPEVGQDGGNPLALRGVPESRVEGLEAWPGLGQRRRGVEGVVWLLASCGFSAVLLVKLIRPDQPRVSFDRRLPASWGVLNNPECSRRYRALSATLTPRSSFKSLCVRYCTKLDWQDIFPSGHFPEHARMMYQRLNAIF